MSAVLDDGSRLTADPSLLWSIGMTIGFFVLRLSLAGSLGFIADEAYYWMWSQNLAFGYYDHPPMVAYFVKLGTLIFGDTRFGVRFVGAVSFLADAFLVYRVVMLLFDRRDVAAWSVIFLNATLVGPVSLIASPDQPLLL